MKEAEAEQIVRDAFLNAHVVPLDGNPNIMGQYQFHVVHEGVPFMALVDQQGNLFDTLTTANPS